jgi:transposase
VPCCASADVIVIPRPLRRAMHALARSRTEPAQVVERAAIVVLAAAGVSNAEIGRRVGCSVQTVRKWRRRFSKTPTLAALNDQPRSGRPAKVAASDRAALIKLACNRPKDSTFRNVWSLRGLRSALLDDVGRTLSVSEIGRVLRAAEIRPHRMKVWLHSPDPEFRPKVKRIADLYLNPPPGSHVVCVDEKPGMQVLERKHPTRLSTAGADGREDFEYIRHGTKTLIAALDVATGKVFGQVRDQRTAKDLVEFMDALAERYPTDDVYVVWDNLNIHLDGKERRWTAFNERHGGRFHFVHTPIHASWVNQIEIWFSILQRRVLRRASYKSTGQLAWRVLGFIGRYNRVEARPFRWKFRGTFHGPRRRRAA